MESWAVEETRGRVANGLGHLGRVASVGRSSRVRVGVLRPASAALVSPVPLRGQPHSRDVRSARYVVAVAIVVELLAANRWRPARVRL